MRRPSCSGDSPTYLAILYPLQADWSRVQEEEVGLRDLWGPRPWLLQRGRGPPSLRLLHPQPVAGEAPHGLKLWEEQLPDARLGKGAGNSCCCRKGFLLRVDVRGGTPIGDPGAYHNCLKNPADC